MVGNIGGYARLSERFCFGEMGLIRGSDAIVTRRICLPL